MIRSRSPPHAPPTGFKTADQHRRRPAPPPARHPYQRPAAAPGRRASPARQTAAPAGRWCAGQRETALHLLAPHQRAGPVGHHVGAGPAKAGSALPAARGRCFHQGASGPGMIGGYARSAASSAPTPGRCQPSRVWSAPASTSSPHYRATTSQDAMNRTDYRTCRPALHLPVLAGAAHHAAPARADPTDPAARPGRTRPELHRTVAGRRGRRPHRRALRRHRLVG